MFWRRKNRSGFVYLAESTRLNGSKQIYTGMTRRPVWVRWREHMTGRGGGYTSRGTWFRPLAAFWSRNPYKAERTIKSWNPLRKRSFARYIAGRYWRRRDF